ncbi:hypothetical protein [Micromonospora coxensis]|uniref:Secreted protein n=1 Tax=Micromonospora coxensis TaxID=356852 RepID=A0A1C5JJP6_9ACTN|nr:hypothetical protein [Micromonospora coxensis]SCG70782.1 hypothetical protein GA0070614_4741 [Micromonospora coxensis]
MTRTRRTRSVVLAGFLGAALVVSLVPAAAPAAPRAVPAARPATTTAAPAAERWSVDLAVTGGDDVNVRWRDGRLRLADSRPAGRHRAAAGGPVAEGTLLTPARTLDRPATRVRAALTAQVARGGTAQVQVRGWRATGWTEWRDAAAGAFFDRPVTRVQARVLLTARDARATTVVRALALTADRAGTRIAPLATVPLSYRVYATRIGLVGEQTANGHIVQPRDHFVALPSRRGLAPLNTGDYSVRVCTTGGARCEYAPVWDVGPWNTRDDYWNPSSVRENWKDLPQGRPEAQAAHQYGYHGGRDQFGRVVLNPAGVDLADGTFWDGLRLTDNAWVDVTYLWTAGGLRGMVGSGPLNVRAGAGTGYAVRGLAATYAHVPIQCYVIGQTVSGPYRTTNRWNRLAAGQYVSHAYISAVYGGTVPPC